MSRRLLFISNLFPDASEPIRGLDNATLLHGLADREGYDIRVLSLRPRLSFRATGAPLALVPRSEDAVFSPEYLPARYIPRIGSRWNDLLMRRDLAPAFDRSIRTFRPDIVLASWLYPDGCAVAPLCRDARTPLVLITQGTDTHAYLRDPVRRKKIVTALALSRATICRSGDLAKQLAQAGADESTLEVVYNGVDTAVFQPRPRGETRSNLGLDPGEPLLLFVGNLLPVKDPLFLVKAVAEANRRLAVTGKRPIHLRMIGDGPMRAEIERKIAQCGAAETIRLLGRQSPAEVARWMSAADRLCLSSVNEGFPNVILEAMASGLPVISTRVGGIAEKIDRPSRGRLLAPGDFEGYVAAILEAPDAPPAGDRLSEEDPGWATAVRRYREILDAALSADA